MNSERDGKGRVIRPRHRWSSHADAMLEQFLRPFRPRSRHYAFNRPLTPYPARDRARRRAGYPGVLGHFRRLARVYLPGRTENH